LVNAYLLVNRPGKKICSLSEGPQYGPSD